MSNVSASYVEYLQLEANVSLVLSYLCLAKNVSTAVPDYIFSNVSHFSIKYL